MNPLAGSPIRLAIRPAEPRDVPALEQLIERSARLLGRDYYAPDEIEAAIAHVFGVDSELVVDGTYLVAEDGQGALLGCGGWSRRTTLFGGDRFGARAAGFLDPAIDAARIRAFFVDAAAARLGVGSALLATCTEQAQAHGFLRLALMATLSGVPFYRRHGFEAGQEIALEFEGARVRFVPMEKYL